ncbi:hypothetical protein [Prochlorothrix hollandica]|uniref:Uncharacterized protein n=1 Tax=Prochlorothrix hollandica PCC 9006 = CALU 1027 TaxID=317619 RepID=A0A0M2Q1L8_PROHO|nr:hypothetical protein [Prochlorothrix hollandica]KKJ00839.1 hypothetical protein PROH_06295 [Prochlorothrix hollandica PCC 9006 = CALU 1027]
MDNFNIDALPQTVQKGFRFTLGATTSLLESLQDGQKREENLKRLTTDFETLAEEWVAQGEVTEQEARFFVDTLVQQATGTQPASTATVTTTASSVTNSSLHQDVKALTEEVMTLRKKVEQLQSEKN